MPRCNRIPRPLAASWLVLAGLFTFGAPVRAAAQSSPREVVRAALRAVEGHRAHAAVAQWQQRLSRDAGDHLAVLGLATVARLQYRNDDAHRLYRMLEQRPTTDPIAIWALLGRGMLLEMQGDRHALELYREARDRARRAGLRPDEGAALTELAFSELGPRGAALAITRLDTAARLLDPDAIELHARRLRYVSVIRVVSGAAGALDSTRAAIALAQRAGEPREEAAGHRTLGLYFAHSGPADSVLPRFAIAESLFARSGDRRGLAYSLMFRGDYLWSRGLLGQAKEAIARALPEAEASRYGDGIGHVHVGLASVASRVGDYPLALRHVARAIARYDSLGDTYAVKLTHALKAQIHLMAGDVDGARGETPWLLDVIETSPELPQRIEGQQVLVSAALLTGRLADAERITALSERHAQQSGMTAWMPRIALARARIALARGQTTRARAELARALGAMDTAHHVRRYEVRVALAEAAMYDGDVGGAAAAMDTAALELDRWRAALSSVELRMLAFQSLTPDAGDQTPGVARVINGLATRGLAPRAFALAERRRARELSDRIVRRDAVFARAADTEVPGARPREVVVDAASVARALPPGTALLEYVVASGGAPTTLFVVTRDGIRAHSLVPEDSIRRDVVRFTDLLEAGALPHPLATSLGDRLLAPALRALPPDVNRLVIVPDGVLHRLPFDALRSGGRFVVERFAVGITPSASVALALQRRRRSDRGSARLVAFADPIIPRGSDTSHRAAFDRAGGLPPLPWARREARLVARYASDADVFAGDDATVATLRRQDLGRVDVLHFATHALVDEQAMTGTALALAGDDTTSGFLTPADLASLQMDTPLVVLSACRSAGGALVGGEGILGLTAPLLEAGARSVVATRWRISDRATLPLIRDFYTALAAGAPVADALRGAKLAAIARGASPREWAAFQVLGDPGVRVPLDPPRDIPPAWIAAGLLVAAVPLGWAALRWRAA